jgi:hypothetical protein
MTENHVEMYIVYHDELKQTHARNVHVGIFEKKKQNN